VSCAPLCLRVATVCAGWGFLASLGCRGHAAQAPDGGAGTGAGGTAGASGASGGGGRGNGGTSGSAGATGGSGGASGSTGGASAGAGGASAGSGGTSAGGAGGAAGGPAGAPGGPLAGPLTISPNPRYFQDAHGRALILAGSHTWNNLQDWGTNGTPRALDFPAYVKFLVAHGQNFTLLWRTELPKFCGLPTTDANAPDFTTAPQPWLRTGPGSATDGAPKFDLTKLDPAYFALLRGRVSALNDAGIWVGVYLFTGEWLNVYRCTGDGYPLTGGNNVNGIDDGGGNGSMDMKAPNAITAIQDAMVDQTIDALDDLPNVLWIVSEEAAASTTWWQGHMIAHVRAREAGKPFQHPVGLAAITGADDQVVYDSDADWVAPFAQLSPSMTCGAGTPKCKVNVNDSDHSYFGMWNDTAQKNRQYAWENFARGNQVAFMDPYVVSYPRQHRNDCPAPTNGICSGPDARWDNFRDNLGYIVAYSRKLNLVKAQPSTTVCSTGYCLGQTPAVGFEMLVYAPTGGPVTVDTSKATAGRMLSYEWFSPVTGKVFASGTLTASAGMLSFPTPASSTTDAVLYVVDAAGHAP
jgi:hypothetical protein